MSRLRDACRKLRQGSICDALSQRPRGWGLVKRTQFGVVPQERAIPGSAAAGARE